MWARKIASTTLFEGEISEKRGLSGESDGDGTRMKRENRDDRLEGFQESSTRGRIGSFKSEGKKKGLWKSFQNRRKGGC